GTIKYIEKDIGDVVTKGEVLVKIDVPDLEGEVAQKEALIEHAAADLKGAEANVVTAEAAVRAAQHQIDLREAERTFRAADLKRDKILFERKVIYEEVIDAARKNLRAAEVGVEAAKSDLAVVQSKLTAAKADVKVKEARINVARKEWEKAKAMAKFAEITAP